MYTTKNDNNRPVDRLEKLVRQHYDSIHVFEKELKLGNGYIANQKKGKGKLSTDVLEKILKIQPEWDLYYIVSGSTTHLKGDNKVQEPSVNYIPLYDVHAIAGNNMVTETQATEPASQIDVGDLLRDSECAIRIYGNSMTPNYPSGCVVGLREVQDGVIEYGHVYVIETTDNRYLKRLYKSDNADAYMCISDNTLKHQDGALQGRYYYEPFDISKETILKIYRVTGVIKRNQNSPIAHRYQNTG